MRENDRIETLRPFGRDREQETRRRRGAVPESDVDGGPPAHEPRGVGGTLDLAFEVLRARFATFVGIGFVLWLPVRLLQLVIAPATFQSLESPEAFLGFFVNFTLGIGSATIVHALTSAVVALVVFAVLRGERLSAAGAFAIALRRLFGVLCIAFVTWIAGVVGMLLCLFPFVYFSWKLALAPSVYVLEGEGVLASLRRSSQLARGSFLRWLGIVCVLFLSSLPLGGVNALFEHPAARSASIEALGISPELFDAIGVPLTALFSGLATAISAVVITVLYLDCRIRREGDDLWQRLAALRANARVAEARS